MNENIITGKNAFRTDLINPRSLVLNYEKETAFLAYRNKNDGKNASIKRSFSDIFSSVNSQVLSCNSNMILPTGCVFASKTSNNNELFLMQEQPGIRSFRLTNSARVLGLVAKMHGKFDAQTRVLELNEVLPENVEKVKKQIALRKQYMKQQKLLMTDDGKTYKYNFRVYFPYTYILIEINRKRTRNGKDRLSFNKMKAAISLDPINTFNDYLYQFPLSNVSSDGAVCTGKLDLGSYGLINIKSYVEKMTGYFWNNRFNADITAGPELYGDVNFLGNWFEWEYISYTDPSAILSLKLSHEKIRERRTSVGYYVFYTSAYKDEQAPILTVNEYTLVDGFESKNSFSDSTVDLENGEAKKHITGISEAISMDGHNIVISSLLKHNKKKFKIMSFDGFKTFNIEDSSLRESGSYITHVQIKDEKKRIHRFCINNSVEGQKFLLNSYRTARNYVLEAKFKDITFTSGELVAYILNGEVSHSNMIIDSIKSIREKEEHYILDFQINDTIVMPKNVDPIIIQKVDILFGLSGQSEDGTPIHLTNNERFVFRTKKLLKTDKLPSPYSISDHLSIPMNGIAEWTRIEYKEKMRSGYAYRNSKPPEAIHITYKILKDNLDAEFLCEPIDMFDSEYKNNKFKLIIPLPPFMISASTTELTEPIEVTPVIHGSETVIIGQSVYQAITECEEGEEVPFKIMREGLDNAKISTVCDHTTPRDDMFFKPAIHHLQSCIENVDGVKTFKVRDLFETDTENEYIHFKVGDEIMLASDWNPSAKSGPSIKKIYDFMTLEDKYDGIKLVTSRSPNSDTLLSTTRHDDQDSVFQKYNMYKKSPKVLGAVYDPFKVSERSGTLYAVIEDGSDDLIIHPLIDSSGLHFLNGISHVTKEIGDLKVGDFVKADIGGIPYFAKKNVYEVAGSVKTNNRYLTIMTNGYTMWTDIIQKNFKIFKRDKLTEKKLEFYTEKVQPPEMDQFMIMYGDMYFNQIGLPIYSKDEIPSGDHGNTRSGNISRIENNEITNTLNLCKTDYATLIESNGDSNFKTLAGFNIFNSLLVKLDFGCSSFRSMYNAGHIIGQDTQESHIASIQPTPRFYDVCYTMLNSSMTNGAAYMNIKTCLEGPYTKYYYYSGPYSRNKSWMKLSTIKTALSSFPTPRILKKSTREVKSYISYKHMGPQNIFYSYISDGHENTAMRYPKFDSVVYSITNDKIFLTEES